VPVISAFSTVAHAQCTPDPTVTSIQTDCPGTDTNGLVVTTVSPVSVPVGGIVTNSGAAAISVAVPYLQTGKVAILVAGTVDGAGNTGIAATAGLRTRTITTPMWALRWRRAAS
jgi:hypothetical protein